MNTPSFERNAALRQLLGSYFHQDFIEEYGSWQGAVSAFVFESDSKEITEAIAELEGLLEQPLEEGILEQTISSLGCNFAKVSRAWLVEVRLTLEEMTADPLYSLAHQIAECVHRPPESLNPAIYYDAVQLVRAHGHAELSFSLLNPDPLADWEPMGNPLRMAAWAMVERFDQMREAANISRSAIRDAVLRVKRISDDSYLCSCDLVDHEGKHRRVSYFRLLPET